MVTASRIGDESTTNVECLDLETKQSTFVQTRSKLFDFCAGSILVNSDIYVFGSLKGDNNRGLSTVFYAFDIVQNKWIKKSCDFLESKIFGRCVLAFPK